MAVAALDTARLKSRTVWMINSTEEGGGVAEMLPTIVSLLRGLGVSTNVINAAATSEM